MSEEFRIEPIILRPEPILRDRGMVVSEKAFRETIFLESLRNIPPTRRECLRNGNIRIERYERLVVERLREFVEAVQPVRPPADNHDLAQPWLQCAAQLNKMLEFAGSGSF